MGDKAERIQIELLTEDGPGGGAVPRAQWQELLTDGTEPGGDPTGGTRRWLARDGADPVGAAWLLPDGRFRVTVAAGRSGGGAGGALLDAVRSAAVAQGSATLLTSAVKDSADEGRLAAAGFRPGEETLRMLLRVDSCDPAALRAVVRAASDGYHLVRWQGVAPSDLVGPYEATRAALDIPPVEPVARGYTRLTVAALGLDPLGDEVVAGFSEILLPGGADATRALQSDTAVLKQHRGHGLGLWVKAAMLQWLLGAHPEVAEVETVCRTGNRHMIEINEGLGFRPAGREVPYQLALT